MSTFTEATSLPYLNDPNQVLDVAVPLGKPLEDLEFVARLYEVTTTIVGGWKNAARTDISIEILSGGITNALYVVQNKARNEKVIVRLFGVGTDLFIDRRIENEVFSFLSMHGMGPTFHGLFGNGRVEGFLPARNLIPNEFSHPKIARGTAATMAKMHAQKIVLSRESSIWSKTKHIISLLQDVHFQSPSLQSAMDSLNLPELSRSAEALHATIVQKGAGLEAKGEARTEYEAGQHFALQDAFTHNDLLSGNVLIPLDFFENDTAGEIKFIDYEYAGYNTRAFDIANHFCEYAGFDFDMDADFPDSEKRRFFIESYVKQVRCHPVEGDPVVLESDDFFNGFENVVLLHVLLSHLFWGVWAALQSSMSTIDFDFMDYATKRVAGFQKHKSIFL